MGSFTVYKFVRKAPKSRESTGTMAKGPKEGIYRSPASSDVEMIYNVHNVQSGKTKSAFLWEPVPSFIENKKEIKKCIFPDGFHQLVLQCTKQWKRQPALRLDQVSPQDDQKIASGSVRKRI